MLLVLTLFKFFRVENPWYLLYIKCVVCNTEIFVAMPEAVSTD